MGLWQCMSRLVIAVLLNSPFHMCQARASPSNLFPDPGSLRTARSLVHRVQTGASETDASGASTEAGTVHVPAATPSLGTDDILVRLKALNISYSVPESDLREWLANPDYTPYPAVAWGLIDLLHDRRLINAVDLDVIVFNYEHAAGGVSPRRIEDIDEAIMTAALLKGFNARYGRKATDLSQISK